MSGPDLRAEGARYVRGGLSLIPIGQNKRPIWTLLPIDPKDNKPTWKPFQSKAADEATVAGWCATPGVTGLGVVCGAISGGLLILDFDEPRLYEAWLKAVEPLAEGLPTQRTGEGFQVALRCEAPGSNQVLAWVPDETQDSGRRVAIETRGEGGYALVPRSLHPNGRYYEAIIGDFANIPTLPMDRVRLLLAAARQLCEAPLSQQELERAQKAPVKQHRAGGGGGVIQEWNRRVPIREMLQRAGYRPWRDRFTRPGEDASPGSVVVFDDTGRSYHHSTNDPLHDGRHSHDSFGVYCAVEHGGDVKAAVKAAAAELGISSSAPFVRSGGSGGSGGTALEGPPDSWPEPRPLPSDKPPVLPFDIEMLPEALRPWVLDIAERIQCPIDFVAVAAMVALAAVVGRRVGIRPKQRDNWLVVPNLWGGVIGRPGVMKTPAIQEPLKPLKNLEIEAKRKFEKEVNERKAADLVAKAKQKQAEAAIREALESEGDERAMELAREAVQDEDSEPVRMRFLVNDSTVEKLGEILNQNLYGVAVFRDELIGLLKSLEKDGRECDRAFYLEAWNGTGRFTFDRIGRGTVDIESTCVSILGGIQPGPLSQYMRAVARGGEGDDGLLQRFQLLVWPDVSAAWQNVDRFPDSQARTTAHAVYGGLANLDPILLGADFDKFEPDGVPFLRFDEVAQAMFNQWREELEPRVRSGEEHPTIESHLSKYRSLIPSLALLIHLADGGTGPVGIGPLKKAIAWGVYLESHARRIYALAASPDLDAARALAKKIMAGEVSDGFALREVYRNGWSGLSTAEDAKGAAELLVDFDWLVEAREPTGGRTKVTYYINPRLPGSEAAKSVGNPSRRTARGDRRGDEGASGGSVGPPPGDSPNSGDGASDWGVVA